jgi:modulator of FtsH protease HflK
VSVAAEAAREQGGGAASRWRPSPRQLSRGLGVLLLVLLALWLGSGFYVVDADQQAVVRRFGAIEARVGPGMHYRLPWPVDRVDVVRTKSVMKTGVGFELPEGEQTTVVGMPLMTGDTNLLSVALVLQYVISSPGDFLFRIEDPQAMIGNLAETVLTETAIGMGVDDLLTTGRLALQEKVKAQTQAMLDRYQSGIQLTSSNIMTIALDPSVAAAFQEVTDAMADREKSRNEARMYANNLIPKARGEANAVTREGHAYKQQRVAEAIGNTDRFLALLKEYQKAPEITRSRLYLEAMERILPKVKIYVVDSEGGRIPFTLRVGKP